MKTVGLTMGEFPLAAIGVFDFRGEDFASDSSYFGLHLHETFLIAHMRRPDGQDVHITRPITLTTSGGLSLSTSKGNGIYQDARGSEFLRGGTFERKIDADGSLCFKGSSGFWAGLVPLTVELHIGDRFTWTDSGHLSLSGRRLGPGTQTYVPSRRGHAGVGVCHTGVFYEAEGTIFGEPISGIFVIEQIFSPPGEVLADSSIRRRFAGGWNGFATVFEDGSSHFGNITFGAGPFRFANIIDGDRHIAGRIESIETEVDAEGLGRRAIYTLANGDQWEFVTTTTLMDMLKLARRLESDVQCHKGYLQRVGETRPRRNWYSIQEWVPARMHNDAVEASGEDVPRGF